MNIKPTWISTHKLMTHATWRWLQCRSGKWSCFCCDRCSCKGVDSNQCLPLQCKLCMKIKDGCFGKSDVYFDVHVKMAFCDIDLSSATFWHFVNFKEFFAHTCLELWDGLNTPNARLACCGLHILTWQFMEVLMYWDYIHAHWPHLKFKRSPNQAEGHKTSNVHLVL